MILNDISDLINDVLQTRTHKEVSELFGRERKWSIMRRFTTDGIRLDTSFLCGLDSLGYELVLQKKEKIMIVKTFNCSRCGESFGAKSKYVLYCSNCRKEVAKEHSAASRTKKKAAGYKPQNEIKSMKQLLSELDNYNKEHGTYLTYGQYVAMVEGR